MKKPYDRITSENRDASGLEAFHPLVRRWFAERFGQATEIQLRAWKEISSGHHVLAVAPTGGGKTLAAFLWGLDSLFTGRLEAGRVRILYVSPLKALNNDVERNLLRPLAELERVFTEAGESFVLPRVATRSGDTPQSERRKMIRKPPEILITTPESLNILLTSRSGKRMLEGVATLILDEIHAVAASKRGTHLMTAIERVARLSGEFQRIALSATVEPVERVAQFVGGFTLDRRGGTARYEARPVSIVQSSEAKALDVRVSFMMGADAENVPGRARSDKFVDQDRWRPLIRDLRRRIKGNRTTLIFANSRRMAEKLTRFLNDGADGVGQGPEEIAWSHHGSLSREIRLVVEERFKEGRLPAIVATSSLELGIDIGSLDEVILVQTPPSVASAIQRIGRAGHRVGEVSRGSFYPLVARDLLHTAVMAAAVLEGRVEPIRPIEGALDVLAQVLLSMTVEETWKLDELYDTIRTAAPYRELPRRHFDLVVEQLAGRYADSRIRELTPRASVDRGEGTIAARKGAARILYGSGGTIPDRGYFQLRVAGSRARLGELDEEFVWERSLGDAFVLGAQTWRITGITHQDVLVEPGSGRMAMSPFWRAEELDVGFFFRSRVGEFLEWAEGLLAAGRQEDLLATLGKRHLLDERASKELLAHLDRQRASTGSALPHRHHLLVEHLRDPQNPDAEPKMILHTGWGGRIHRPLAMALAAAWEEKYDSPIEVLHDDSCLLVQLTEEIRGEELMALLGSDRVETLLRSRLESSGFFGARFRENAGRSLLLPRGDARRRVPLWLNRQKAKKLLDSVSRYGDFPVVLETWRSCLQDELDLDGLHLLLEELADGRIEISETVTSKFSPFAENMAWKETNQLMYEDDVPSGRGGGLAADLVRELVFSSRLRPRLARPLVRRFEEKLQRIHPGYAPAPGQEMREWVEERIYLPEDEWAVLKAAVERDHGSTPEADPRIFEVELPGSRRGVLADNCLNIFVGEAGESAQGHESEPRRISFVSGPEASDPLLLASSRLADWLRFYGPVPTRILSKTLGIEPDMLGEILELLVEQEAVVVDHLFEGSEEEEVCDAENLERLLRLARAEARPSFEALPLRELPLFLAGQQGLVDRRDGVEGLESALEGLFLFPAPATTWEEDFLPARLDPYFPSWLDSLMQESELLWIGCGRQKLTFSLAGDLDLLAKACPTEGGEEAEDPVFPPGPGRFSLSDLIHHSGLSRGELEEGLWDSAWHSRVSNDSFAAVRRSGAAGFRAEARVEARSQGQGVRRGRFGSRRQKPVDIGHWFPLELPDLSEDDALDTEELDRERVRLLLRRYGILFRELLMRELPGLQWRDLFRSLRLMELSGEVLAGHFFRGIPGPQFLSREAWRKLRRGLAADAVYWMSAVDPASPCGMSLDGLGDLPRRLPGTHLVYRGADLVLVSERKGRRLDIRVSPEDEDLGAFLAPLRLELERLAGGRASIEVETINGEPAVTSDYRSILSKSFEVTSGARSLRLWRRYVS